MPDRMLQDMPDRMPERNFNRYARYSAKKNVIKCVRYQIELSEVMPDRMREDWADGTPGRFAKQICQKE